MQLTEYFRVNIYTGECVVVLFVVFLFISAKFHALLLWRVASYVSISIKVEDFISCLNILDLKDSMMNFLVQHHFFSPKLSFLA